METAEQVITRRVAEAGARVRRCAAGAAVAVSSGKVLIAVRCAEIRAVLARRLWSRPSAEKPQEAVRPPR